MTEGETNFGQISRKFLARDEKGRILLKLYGIEWIRTEEMGWNEKEAEIAYHADLCTLRPSRAIPDAALGRDRTAASAAGMSPPPFSAPPAFG